LERNRAGAESRAAPDEFREPTFLRPAFGEGRFPPHCSRVRNRPLPARAEGSITMTPMGEGRPRPQSVPEAIVRTLRHEVGDLLQTVYAAVAILKERLPPDCQTERRILTDLRGRAETCRDLLDTVHDLVCPITLALEPADVPELLRTAAARVGARFPRIALRLETSPVPAIRADSRRVTQVATVLLAGACSAANATVVCRVGPGSGPGEVTITVTDDGPGVPPGKEGQLFNMLTTTPHGHLGPGLTLARRLVGLHGGRITAGNLKGGGFRVEVTLPRQPPEPAA
jgi:signal transduction histidine kinase